MTRTEKSACRSNARWSRRIKRSRCIPQRCRVRAIMTGAVRLTKTYRLKRRCPSSKMTARRGYLNSSGAWITNAAAVIKGLPIPIDGFYYFLYCVYDNKRAIRSGLQHTVSINTSVRNQGFHLYTVFITIISRIAHAIQEIIVVF